ncbi:heparan-alpha-glucosaminide N-acetyltransferase domain-containing protein [Demequina sp.]|uniref:heparan-alpha-glucosaminide N-acetyltransferase domain-containing protein n=1 Tax=Demequina sp. TaxID=2050685 RepID=UPI0025DB050B|nr:heparan-alpha-glucosaminide N-acetyltransferase domain-containing protein [Demequina sp.]
MTGRIAGLDVARGLAVMGMVAAHVGDDGSRDGVGWPWLVVTHGRSAALFAVLAGVTMSLMLAGAGGRDDARAVRHTRARIAARAGALIGLGIIMQALHTPVDVILVNLGVMFLLALPLLRLPSWALLTGAAAVMAIGNVVVSAVTPDGWWAGAPVIGKLWSFHYPALSWIAYIMVGIVIGRMRLRTANAQAMLVGAGVMVASATLLVHAVAGSGTITSLEPHSYTPVEMTHNAGVAAATIGLCCWLAPKARAVLSPIAALGSMALSAYVLHLLVIAAVGREVVYEPSNVSLVALEVSLVLLAWGWRTWLGQGPLERLLTYVSNAAGELAVPDQPRAGTPSG